jgi:hypothetical protein
MKILRTLLLIFALCLGASAQEKEHFTRLEGTVIDHAGSVIPSVKIVLTNDSGRKFKGITNGSGEYLIFAPPGTYTIETEYTEYQPWEMIKIGKYEIASTKKMTLDLSLRVDEKFKQSGKSISDKPEVQLTTEIVSRRYCKGDNEPDALDLNLKLSFENTGNQPLILYKSSDRIVQQIVRDIDGNIEFDSRLGWLTSSKREVDESSLGKSFAVLPPNKIYEMQTTARIFVAREGTGKTSDAIGNGEHLLQVRVASWHGAQELADRLQQSWEQSGLLWTNSILSLPMKFKVDSKRKLSRCV